MPRQSRRDFLKHSATGVGAALAATALPALDKAVAADKSVPWKYSMCNETFEDWPQGRIFRFLAECGYQAVEIAPFTINTDVTEIPARQRTRLRKQAEQAGIEICGLHWLLSKTEGLHLTSPDADVRKRTTEYLGELARFCAELGGTKMIFGSPKQRNLLPGVSYEQGTQHAVEVLRGAMPVLEKTGVVLGLEPLGPKETNFIVNSADAVALAKLVDSPHCKMMLDCKAMVQEPTPIPELIRKHAAWMVHFHANDPNLRGPGMGDLDFLPIFKALQDVKFSGWVSVEVFDYTPGPERLARESFEYMKKIEGKLVG
ncbi:MAG: sugar phosphate isomerase/epimerase [Pirellulales bacterium]|nr:sugar phosphate isomerase/epimerase [Pirellulales bacterium]